MNNCIFGVRYYEPLRDEMTIEECSSRDEALQMSKVYKQDGIHDPVKVVCIKRQQLKQQ